MSVRLYRMEWEIGRNWSTIIETRGLQEWPNVPLGFRICSLFEKQCVSGGSLSIRTMSCAVWKKITNTCSCGLRIILNAHEFKRLAGSLSFLLLRFFFHFGLTREAVRWFFIIRSLSRNSHVLCVRILLMDQSGKAAWCSCVGYWIRQREWIVFDSSTSETLTNVLPVRDFVQLFFATRLNYSPASFRNIAIVSSYFEIIYCEPSACSRVSGKFVSRVLRFFINY